MGSDEVQEPPGKYIIMVTLRITIIILMMMMIVLKVIIIEIMIITTIIIIIKVIVIMIIMIMIINRMVCHGCRDWPCMLYLSDCRTHCLHVYVLAQVICLCSVNGRKTISPETFQLLSRITFA